MHLNTQKLVGHLGQRKQNLYCKMHLNCGDGPKNLVEIRAEPDIDYCLKKNHFIIVHLGNSLHRRIWHEHIRKCENNHSASKNQTK